MGHSSHEPWAYQEDEALVEAQRAYERDWQQAEQREMPAERSLVDVVREVTRRKKLGRV